MKDELLVDILEKDLGEAWIEWGKDFIILSARTIVFLGGTALVLSQGFNLAKRKLLPNKRLI